MPGPRDALQLLEAAAASGDLGGVCRRHGVDLLIAFGSAVRDGGEPHDLDLAVRFTGPDGDLLALLHELSLLSRSDDLDLLDLGRAGPVARERPFLGGRVLHEAAPSLAARAQIAATMERLDTAWLRELDLRLLAAGGQE